MIRQGRCGVEAGTMTGSTHRSSSVQTRRHRLIVLALLVFLSAVAAPQDSDHELTADERAWLVDHPEVRIGIMEAWPPMDYVDQRGRLQGIGVDYIRILNRQLSGILTIVPGSFEENH